MSSGKDGWFRSSKWDKEAQELFETKLSKSREEFHKAQYLKIKAYSLQQGGNLKAAALLLQRMIREYPNEGQIVLAYQALGQIYEEQGNIKRAEEYYNKCIDHKKEHPSGWGIYSQFYLASLIVKTKQEDKYQEAESLLDDYKSDSKLLLNSEMYKYCVLRARLALQLNKWLEVASYARYALVLAVTGQKPQFPRHKDVGLVNADPKTLQEMRKIASE